MANKALFWDERIDISQAPLTSTASVFEIASPDGLTITRITSTGADFTYDGNGVPTAGTILKVELVQNVTGVVFNSTPATPIGTVMQTFDPDAAVTMATFGAQIAAIGELQDDITWYGLFDTEGEPLVHNTTRIVFENSDNSFTVLVGTGFVPGQKVGSVTHIIHYTSAYDPNTDTGGAVNTDLDLTLTPAATALVAAALFPDDASEYLYVALTAGTTLFTINQNFFNYDAPGAPVQIDQYFAELINSAGNDTFTGHSTGSEVHFGLATSGVTVNLGTAGQQNVGGGLGLDTFVNIRSIAGSEFNDTLTTANVNNGGGFGNGLWGLEGNDTLVGLQWNDFLHGDAFDVSDVDAGNDVILAGFGNDTVYGGGGSDSLAGGPGVDVVHGDGGDDFLYVGGTQTGDQVLGDAGNDTLVIGGGTIGGEPEFPTYAFADNRTAVFGSIEKLSFAQVGGVTVAVGVDRLAYFNASQFAGLSSTLAVQGSSTSSDILNFFINSGTTLNLSGLTFTNWVSGWSIGDDLGNGNFSDAAANNWDLIAIQGSNGADVITGTSQNDHINGDQDFASTADIIHGGNGNDVIDGWGGADQAFGDAGDDVIQLWDDEFAAGEVMNGGTGTDTLMVNGTVNFAGSTVTGFERLAFFTDSSTAANTLTFTGGQFLNAFGASATIRGSVGADLLRIDMEGAPSLFYTSSFTFENWGANDRLDVINASSVVFVASANVDNIQGGDGNDYFYTYDGDDIVAGNGGIDVLILGDGNDTGYGGDGQDYLFGDAGNDTLSGDAGVDVFLAGTGDDIMNGGTEGDYFYGDEGADVGIGGGGNDIFVMGVGNDTANGEDGQDYFYMGAGDDIMSGGAGVDVMLGEGGNDTFNGGLGTDYMFLGPQGAGDNDTILVDKDNSGVMVVFGFEAGGTNDSIRLTGSYTSFQQVQANIFDVTAAAGFCILTLDADTSVWLIGVTPGALTAADFVFA